MKKEISNFEQRKGEKVMIASVRSAFQLRVFIRKEFKKGYIKKGTIKFVPFKYLI